MVMSPIMLCLRHVMQRARPACHCSINAARALRRELACIPKPEVGRCQRLVQRKGHTTGLLQSHLEMQAKSFCPVLCSIDAASVKFSQTLCCC